jgi:hypothetical protein
MCQFNIVFHVRLLIFFYYEIFILLRYQYNHNNNNDHVQCRRNAELLSPGNYYLLDSKKLVFLKIHTWY